MTMPAGEYFIGDLCYVIEEWDDYCKTVIVDGEVLDGEFVLPDGRKFASYGTMFGDGVYEDNCGKRYPVDAGVIGCILTKDITRKDMGNICEFGTICVFGKPFETYEDKGKIYFGTICVNTSDESEEDEYEYYDEENTYG
jgi:hypothetical protein